MQESQHDYTADQLRLVLLRIRDIDGVDVSIMADLFGVSESLVYQWCSEESSKLPTAEQLVYGSRRLADKLGNTRLIRLLLGTRWRLVEAENGSAPPGSIREIAEELFPVMSKLIAARDAGNPDRFAEGRRQFEQLVHQLETLEGRLRNANGE